MHTEKACLSSISRRTRSQFDVYYKNCHEEIKKKRNQESITINNETSNAQDFDSPNNSEEDENFLKKGVQNDINLIKFNDSESSSDVSEENSDEEDNEDDEDDDNNDYYEEYVKNISKTARKTIEKIRKKPRSPPRKKACVRKEDVIDILVDSIWKEKDLPEKDPVRFPEGHLSQVTLPLKFKFGDDQESSVPEKTEEEKEIESLFQDLEMGLWESEIGLSNTSLTEDEDTISTTTDESGAPCCCKGEHDLVLDEQRGLVCKYCSAVIMEIKYIMPSFYVESPERRSSDKRERKDSDSKESQNSLMNQIQFQTSASDTIKSSIQSNGTVLDLIPDDEKKLYPHQREGYEFMWKNIAGDTQIKNLLQLPADSGGGCIISHAPGTGKTRLTIVFLQSFLKLYPACRPVIIAPKGMLLTWEQEFKKWEVGIEFHNLNESKLSRQETEIAGSVLGQTRGNKKETDYVRLLKLYSWMKGGSVLGISYRLFEQLAGEDKGKGSDKKFRKILLELPGLLVLDEGHTPRNSQSLMWKALTKVMTQRRVILSGTPFQNNFSELYNTLCLVNPRFSQQIMETSFDAKVHKGKRKGKCNAARGEWDYLTNSIGKNNNDDQAIKKLGLMMKPFVHIHKGGILQKTLPGIRDCLILLRPTDIQRELLQNISNVEKFLDQAYLASLISIHPSLAAKNPEFSIYKKKLKKIESDPNAGVKTRFLIELIRVSARLNEKVLIFSQFIDPLHHIQNLLKSHFSWNEGKEVIYMDGDLGLKQRQISINSFNDKTGKAKVMLASQRACSEGISLIGASRVVLLDVVWNPAVERQAISRAYRIGQEKIVYVYHLVTLMEVKKFARQAEKERISELIFCKENGGGRSSSSCNDVVEEDDVLEAMVGHSSLSGMFEKIVHQPKESDMVDTFGFVDL